MVSVEVGLGQTLRLGTPRRLLQIPEDARFFCYAVRSYAVAPSGQFFYATQLVPATPRPPATQIHLAMNWVEELKARVAAGQPK